MNHPIKNNSTSTQANSEPTVWDTYEKALSELDDYDQDGVYGEEFDFEARMDEEISFPGLQGGQQNLDVITARKMLADIELALSESNLAGLARQELVFQLKEIKGQLSRMSAGVLNPQLSNALLALQAQLFSQGGPGSPEANADGDMDVTGNETAPSSPEGFVQALESFKDSLGGMEHLSSQQIEEYQTQIEQWIIAINLGEETPDDLMSDFEDLQMRVGENQGVPSGVMGLAQITGEEPSRIQSFLKDKGIDLDRLPNPPTADLIESLLELTEGNELIDNVRDAVLERQASYQENQTKARAQNNRNTRDGKDYDEMDSTFFQALYDLKYHQDDKSQGVANAMRTAARQIVPLLQALYPDVDIELMEPEESDVAWRVNENEYRVADQIKFGNVTLDLFENATGRLRPSTDWDVEPEIEIITLKYDGSGDGRWDPEDMGLMTYGDSKVRSQRY